MKEYKNGARKHIYTYLYNSALDEKKVKFTRLIEAQEVKWLIREEGRSAKMGTKIHPNIAEATVRGRTDK